MHSNYVAVPSLTPFRLLMANWLPPASWGIMSCFYLDYFVVIT